MRTRIGLKTQEPQTKTSLENTNEAAQWRMASHIAIDIA